jgi:hypothetical protein
MFRSRGRFNHAGKGAFFSINPNVQIGFQHVVDKQCVPKFQKNLFFLIYINFYIYIQIVLMC